MEAGDFVPPMLAVTADTPFSRPNWWFETKWDGYRAIVSQGRDFHVYSRRGHDLAAWYPAVREAQKTLPGNIVLDAELVAWVDGRPSFSDLQQKTASSYLLMVFDCLYAAGRWLLHEPLERRQQELRRQVQTAGIVVVADGIEGRGEMFFGAIQDMGLEGVMAKRLDGPYLPGRRSPSWQKFLAYQVEWFWVVAVSQAEDGVWYWSLGEEQQGRIHSVGRVHAPSRWRPAPGSSRITRMAQPFHVEVAYRERTREGHLRHAQIRQWREGGHGGTAADSPSRADSVPGDSHDPS